MSDNKPNAPNNQQGNNQTTVTNNLPKPVSNQSNPPLTRIKDISATTRPKPNNTDIGGIQTKGIKQ